MKRAAQAARFFCSSTSSAEIGRPSLIGQQAHLLGALVASTYLLVKRRPIRPPPATNTSATPRFQSRIIALASRG